MDTAKSTKSLPILSEQESSKRKENGQKTDIKLRKTVAVFGKRKAKENIDEANRYVYYSMSKKLWPILCSNLPYKMGHYFFGTQYLQNSVSY